MLKFEIIMDILIRYNWYLYYQAVTLVTSLFFNDDYKKFLVIKDFYIYYRIYNK